MPTAITGGEKYSAKAMVDGTKVEILFVEENGNGLSLDIDNTMTDYANKPVSVLRVKTEKTNFVKLVSKIKYCDTVARD